MPDDLGVLTAPARWREAAAVYLERRVVAMVFLGISSGFPFGVLADPLTAWLHESGVSKTDIGLFALVGLPYSVKFLWAPLMDRLPLPVMTRLFGRRRGWALLTQACLLLVVALMGQGDPSVDLVWLGVMGLAIAFASASQDIVIDAYRIEILTDDQMAAGAANVVFGWRVGQLGAAAAPPAATSRSPGSRSPAAERPATMATSYLPRSAAEPFAHLPLGTSRSTRAPSAETVRRPRLE